MKTKLLQRLFAALSLLLVMPLSAQIPSLINYQGRLTDAQGNPVTGNRTMAVKIYDAPTGGNMTYEETIGTVEVVNGAYNFRFGSGGSLVVSANETIATTNGINQIFDGALQGAPTGGILNLTDGTYTWSTQGGSSNPSAFSVTYNGAGRSFQVIYLTQVPIAGRAIVASYQKSEVQAIDASLANAETYLALSVNGMEEVNRTRLLAVPYALKAKESADAQALVPQVSSLSGNLSTLQSQTSSLDSGITALTSDFATLSANVTAIETETTAMSGNMSALVSRFRVLEISGNLSFGNSSNSRRLTIANTGFDRLSVNGIICPEGFSGSWEGVVPAGGSQNITVSFLPNAEESYGGNLIVNSDASSGSSLVPISGKGARIISLSGELAFGTSPINSSFQRSFTISNSGTMNLTISGISYPSGFSGNWSGTIPPGGMQVVSVTFLPTLVQSYSGNLTVASNASEGSGIIALSGYGLVATPTMVSVTGGTLPQTSGLSGTIVSSFQIGKYEVMWSEWQNVRSWAINNGYSDLGSVGVGSAASHPVRSVNWYDAIKWSNAKSEMEGLVPVYVVNGTTYRTGQSVPTINSSANGYRLPTEAEWEWAALGGVNSLGYTYSGSNDVNQVAWYFENSAGAEVAASHSIAGGRGTWPVGMKSPNELGIHDMSGNIFEWIFEATGVYNYRGWRGGSFGAGASACEVAYRDGRPPTEGEMNNGFRLVRKAP